MNTTSSAPKKLTGRKKHLMIVNNSASQAAILKGVLQQRGDYSVLPIARSVLGIVEVVRSRRPSLILMDLMMPGMHGGEVISTILQQFPGLPILLVSAYDKATISTQILQAQQAGAKGFCAVPKLGFKPGERVPDSELKRSGRALYSAIDALL